MWNNQQRGKKGRSKSVQEEVNLYRTEGKPFPGSSKLAAVEFQKWLFCVLEQFQLLLCTTMAKIKGLYKKEAVWEKFEITF